MTRVETPEEILEEITTTWREQLAGFGINVSRDDDYQLFLPTPTGAMRIEHLPVGLGPGTLASRYRRRAVVLRADDWEEHLSLERMAYAVVDTWENPTCHLILRDQLAERFWQRYKTPTGGWFAAFDIPDLSASRAMTLEDFPEDADVQLGLDGSATLDPHTHRYLGFRQRDVLRHIALWPSTSTEVGTFIHQQLLGGRLCGQYARDDKYHTDYHGLGCCAEASSTGSQVTRSLADSLDRVDETRRWKVRDEAW